MMKQEINQNNIRLHLLEPSLPPKKLGRSTREVQKLHQIA